jgi:acyl carrier protein
MFMDRDQIFSEVAGIVREILDLPDLAVNMATAAENLQAWDSFNHINIVVAIEAHFGVRFHTAEIEEVKNVGELVDMVHHKLRARKSG